MLLTPTGFFNDKRLTVFSLVDSTQANEANSGTAPVDIQEGDLIVFLDLQSVGSAADGNNSRIPTGFTQAFGHSGTFKGTSENYTTRIRVSQKIAVGTEGGSTLLGMNSGTKFCFVFRGNHKIISSTPDSFSGASSASGGTSSVTTNYAKADLPCLVVSCSQSNYGTTSISPTPTHEMVNGATVRGGITVALGGTGGSVVTSATRTGSTLTGRHVAAGLLLLGIK